MNKILKKNVLLIVTAVTGSLFFITSNALAHCQIPCGIYDDHARVKTMLEDAATIEKSVRMITQLSGKSDAASSNQLIRWVMNKEQHAQNIIDIISDYFLTQRVKSSQNNYSERLADHHAVIVAAMKTKQNAEKKYVDKLREAIEALIAYYPAHRHKN